MEIKVISETIQEYKGTRYYKCGPYFQRRGKRLHVRVWEDHYGRVPKGFHLHHKDCDRSNNEIANLELMTAHDHMVHHTHTPEARMYQKEHIKTMQDLATDWHRSKEGRAWHSEHAKEQWKKKEPVKYVCSCCGKEFETTNRYSPSQNAFCSNKCRAKYRRDSGVDNIEAICEYCGKTYIKSKYSRQRFCGRECGRKHRWGNEDSKH